MVGVGGAAAPVGRTGDSARAEADPAVQRAYADEIAVALGWRPVPGEFHLFAVEIDEVTFIRYDEATGDQFVTQLSPQWPGREYVRRGTTATSVGDPEPRRDLLEPR